jgi:hypothetical protein
VGALTKTEMHGELYVYPGPGICCKCTECRIKRKYRGDPNAEAKINKDIAKLRHNKEVQEKALRKKAYAIETAAENKDIVEPKKKLEAYPQCVCGKFAYPDEETANAVAVGLAHNGVSEDIMRTYECPLTLRWHVTRQNKRNQE